MSDTQYSDDQTISDETLLLRRIPSSPNLNVVWDNNTQTWRPSSASFENHPNGSPMSVGLSDTLAHMGRSLESMLEGYEEGFSLAAFTARVARDNGQGVAREPTPSEPAHGVLFGEKSKSVRRRRAKSATWIVPPDLQNPV